MDNYLSYRWPDSPPAPRPPQRPAPAPRRRRRVLRNLFVVLLLLSLLAGVALGGWYLTRTALEQLAQGAEAPAPGQTQLPAPGHGQNRDPSQSDPSQTSDPVRLPRAAHGLGVTLELDQTRGERLSPGDIYELVLPSVVSITSRAPDGGGAGSGVIMREDGYVLTNYHVIKGAFSVTVMVLPDGASYPAALVGYDDQLDVAVLKIDAAGLTAARFGDSDALRVGDPAYAIGNPMGYLYGTMTDGIISFLDRSQTVEDTDMTLIQTTAVLNSGNSGGALVNDRGQVVGITVAKISGSSSASAPQVEGLGFAIPITAARPFIDRILDAGETWRPAMGILCYAGELDGQAGIIIQSVTAGGPADLAGLRNADLILTANGRPAPTLYALKRVLNDAGVGGRVSVEFLRNGERMQTVLTLVDSADLPA